MIISTWGLTSSAQVDKDAIDLKLDSSYNLQLSEPAKAYSLALEALMLSQAKNYTKGIAEAKMRLGYIQYVQGSYDSALLYLKDAYLKRKSINDIYGAIGAGSVISSVYKERGDKDSTFSILYELLRIADMEESEVLTADVLMTIGNAHLDYENYTEGIDELKKAKSIYESLNNVESKSLVISALGVGYFSADNMDSALHYFMVADTLLRFFNDPLAVARNTNNIGLCYQNQNQNFEALKHFDFAVESFDRLNMSYELAVGYNNLGTIYSNINMSDSAIFYFSKALSVARSKGMPDVLKSSYKYLSDEHRRIQDYKLAFKFQDAYNSISDSLLNEAKIKQIAEMKTKYETDKKIQENNLLSAENKIKSTQRDYLILASFLLLLGLLVLGAFFRQRIKVNAQREEIAQKKIDNLLSEQELATYRGMVEGQEEERNRIAKDLHDRVGSMLSTAKVLMSSLANTPDGSDKEDYRDKLNRTAIVLDEAVKEVRQVSHNLSTGVVSTFGLISALRDLAQTINTAKLLEVKIITHGLNERLNLQVEIGLYRMIQEIINNTLKHARATEINVLINKMPDELNVTVEDNGRGFDLERVKMSQKRGIGLMNLEARASGLQGQYTIDSQPGKGSISIISIPLD